MAEMQDLMPKGITVPSYFVSAVNMRKVMQFWFRNPLPMYRILRGNLQQFFNQPLEAWLRELGCSMYKLHVLEQISIEGRRVRTLHLRYVARNQRHEVAPDLPLVLQPQITLVC